MSATGRHAHQPGHALGHDPRHRQGRRIAQGWAAYAGARVDGHGVDRRVVARSARLPVCAHSPRLAHGTQLQAYYQAAEPTITAMLPQMALAGATVPAAVVPGIVLADAVFAVGFVLHSLALPLGVASAAFLVAARK